MSAPDDPLVLPEDPQGSEPEFSLREMEEKKRQGFAGGASSIPVVARPPLPERIDLRSYAELLKRRIWTVILVCVIVLGSTIFLSLRLPNVYRARVILSLRPEAEMSAGKNPMIPFSGPNLDKVVSRVMMRPVFYEAAKLLRQTVGQMRPLVGKVDQRLQHVLEAYFLEGPDLLSTEDREKVTAFATRFLEDLYREQLGREGETSESVGRWLKKDFQVDPSVLPLLDRVARNSKPLGGEDTAIVTREGLALLRALFSETDLRQMHRKDFLKLSPEELASVLAINHEEVSAGISAELSQAAGGELIYVLCTGSQANLVALRANAVAIAFVKRDMDMQQEGGQQSEEALSRLLDLRKGDLVKKRKEIQDAKAKLARDILKDGEGPLSADTTLLLDQVRQLRTDVEKARLQRDVLKIRIEQSRKRIEKEPDFQKATVTYEDPRVKELQKKEMELSVALQTYREGHPIVETLRREIEVLKRQIAQAQQSDIPTAYTQGRNPVREKLQERLMEAEGELAELEASLPLREVSLRDLEARLGSLRQQEEITVLKLVDEEKIFSEAVQSIQTGLEQARISKDSALSSLRIEEQASVPAGLVGPNRTQNYVLGFMVGLALGVASAFFLEHLDHTIQSTTELQQETQLTPLGIIPLAVHGQELLLPEHPLSELSEVYGVIRNNIRHSTRQAPERLLLLVSALPAEGKSLICANLATSYSLEGSNTLLVNADLRCTARRACTEPMTTTRPVTVGLSEYLSGDLPLEEVLYPTTVPGLTVIPNGAHVSNPARLLRSERMRQFLRLVEQRFAVVLIDSPAVLPVVDATLISNQVRGVLLVVSAAKTPIPALQQCMARLRHVNSPLIGSVLNMVKRIPSRHFFYGYGSYSQHSKQENA